MTNTPQRFDHTDDGFETANDGDFVSYNDYVALLARAEQAEADADSWKNRAIHQNGVANAALEENERLTARLSELEKACAEWAEVSQSNYQRAEQAEARVKELEAEREEDHKKH
jgi:hypothetical protein